MGEQIRELTSNPEEGPRYKILIVEFTPKGKSHLLMAEKIFSQPQTEEDKIENYHHVKVTELRAPSYKEIPDKLERELAADAGFNPTEFYPENPEQYAGIVLTGSPFSSFPRTLVDKKAGEKFPYHTRWKKETIDFIRAAVKHEVPILGLCFGGQMLAEALGGETEIMKTKDSRDVWEWGWSLIKKVGGDTNDPIMRGLPSEFVAAENHHDCISRLPSGGTLLCENEYGIQGFRVDNKKDKPVAWGFQFHAERPPEKVNRMLLVGEDKQNLVKANISLEEFDAFDLDDKEFKKWFKSLKINKDLRRKLKWRRKLKRAGLNADIIAELGESYHGKAAKVFSNFLNYVRSRV